MSNPIRYDPLLVHALASELHTRLAGRRSAPAPLFAADRSVTLPLEGDEALVFELHPSRGWARLLPRETAGELGEARVLGVSAPEDERRLSIQLALGSRFAEQRREIVFELMDNQWNALLLDAESGAIITLLRGRSDTTRTLAPGLPYRPPAPHRRLGRTTATREQAHAAWLAQLGPLPPEARAGVLVREFANTGTMGARALLAHAGSDEAALERAFDWWWKMQPPEPTHPVLLHLDGRAQPYPAPIPGVPSEPAASLLEAMERAAAHETAAREEQPSAQEAPDAETLALAEGRREMAARRVRRLEEQIARAAEAPQLRARGDLLLAHLHRVPRGAAAVVLPDWEGGEVEIALDPALSATENAKLWYERARRRERAGARLPELLAEAEAEAERWAEVAANAARGEPLPAWAVARLTSAPKPAANTEAEALPYRRYRTSGGLEVWVGKNARSNDRLTFGHARPEDVWLHARSVAGSHVVLRWKDAAGAPPARDLEEAASLAALFSRARTSAVVPVDWTRRKHVRKPRGAAAGAVLPQRVKTLFVEPDEALEKRLREPD